MSKVLLTHAAFSQEVGAFPTKSLLCYLSRSFWLRTDKHTRTKCFVTSHDSVFKYIPSGHGYMSRHLIEVYVSRVICDVSKPNTCYSEEENPSLKKRK